MNCTETRNNVIILFQTESKSPLTRDRVLLVPETRTLEECSVAGVGRFTAFTDGSLRVVFSDRTCLDMRGLHWQPHIYGRLLSQNVVSCRLFSVVVVRVTLMSRLLYFLDFVLLYTIMYVNCIYLSSLQIVTLVRLTLVIFKPT